MSDKNEDPFADDSIDDTDNPNGPDGKQENVFLCCVDKNISQ